MMDAEKISFDDGLFEKAVNEDSESIEIMFKRFIPSKEEILYCNYFGIRGLWGFGGHTWGCVTNKRVAILELEPFRKMLYSDAPHEKIDHCIIYRPNYIAHYIGMIIFLVTMSLLWTALILFIFAPRTTAPIGYVSQVDPLLIISVLVNSVLIGFSLPFIWHISIRGYYRLVNSGLIYIIRRNSLYLFSRKKYMFRVIELHKYSMSAKANC